MISSKSLLVLLIKCMISLTNVVLEAEAKAFFVFGDSMVDSGNNNYMVTLIRADKPPYGIDYPGQVATGRFSNGYNIPDLISQAIGEEATMPYMSPEFTGEKLLVGANFASAGVGILNDTGTHFGHHIKIRMQIQYFKEYQERLSDRIGPEESQRLVNKALTLVTLGANDFVNNYYLPLSPTSRQFSIPDYVVYLISEYRKILMRLYEMGLRRILVTGTGPLGCAPAELAVRSQDGECSPELQTTSTLFIAQLQQLLECLNSEIGSDVFIGAHTRQTNLDFVSNPQKYGSLLRSRAI
ncbi:GDSL esterase/lipase LTL1-like isoform X2 [Rutidosis leptorrhynchoides]|uniref:GDSL esterase/lipase LTL1-like isoform X2 n=1 Tax=Rutidosis leptorrhynchoides TaxID=125765 RepID=UPI003A992B8C